MVIVHAFLALLAGFASITLLGLLWPALVARVIPSWAGEQPAPEPGFAVASLGFSFLSAVSGGYATAWAAATNPLYHVLALGIVVLTLSALSALQAHSKQPIWYQLTLVAVSPLGVMAGGLARLRWLGIL